MSDMTPIVADFVKAETPEKLRDLLIRRNLTTKTQTQVINIVWDGKFWVAWYYRDIKRFPLMAGFDGLHI